VTRPVLPRPDEDRGLHHLLPAAVAAVTGSPTSFLPLPPVRGVAVLVIDGLGHHQLSAHTSLAPTLAGGHRLVGLSPFPTTTATSLTTIGTGLHPGRHGVTGYSFAVPGEDEPLFALTWSLGAHDPAREATDRLVPEQLQPEATAFDRARARGVRPVTVLREEFVTSGLTRAGLRGGDVAVAAGLEPTLDAVLDALAGAGPTVVYAHHPDLDMIGHLSAPGSDPWQEELARIDATVAGAVARLPGDTALVVTADHGMVAIPEDGFVELTERPELLAGVAMLCGDPRARQLHTVPGAREAVLDAWRDHAGDRAHVVTREEAVAAGWFGPVATAAIAARIGDVVVSARDLDVAWVHRDRDLLGGRLPGMHGALTPEEQEVPLATFVAGRSHVHPGRSPA
jgi:predicted AlkP superfamily pyrophosphatase or phosphodiesterase